MSKIRDLTGERFGKLIVSGFNRKEIIKGYMYRYYWNCVCDCGNECVVEVRCLKNGNTQSCGCLRGRHHMTDTNIYKLWKGIKSRCFNKNHMHYDKYGGRGITICKEWMVFENFYDWAVKNGYKEGLSIDRVDNDKGYCPENCRWVNQSVQNSNKRNNVLVEYQGEIYTLSEVARKVDINRKTLKNRLQTLSSPDDIYKKENRSKRSICQFDLAGNFIKKWESIESAQKSLGIEKGSGNISHCCRGKTYSAYGYRWKYTTSK